MQKLLEKACQTISDVNMSSQNETYFGNCQMRDFGLRGEEFESSHNNFVVAKDNSNSQTSLIWCDDLQFHEMANAADIFYGENDDFNFGWDQFQMASLTIDDGREAATS